MKIRRKNNKDKGFSLIELLLVLGVISISMVGIISYLGKQAEQTRAKNAGEQFAEIGRALGNYITREASVLNSCLTPGGTPISIPLSVLTNTTGTTAVGGCTLNNRQLLPPTTSATSIFNTGYNLLIRKNNSSNISGLVLSSTPVRDAGAAAAIGPRYDWLGVAMQSAGPQSGMTFQATGANSLRGLGGGWALSNADFPQINSLGLFGYRVSYQGNNDDIYLRLDGAYPMRGNLNMGNYNINNATDINFNGWLNGNNALLNNLKTGYISNAGSIVTDTLQVQKAITTSDFHTRPMPAGWTDDYIHTWDIYAEGTIATGQDGLVQASMNSSGLVTANNIRLNLPGCSGAIPGLTNDETDTLRGADCSSSYTGLLSDRLPQYVSKGAQVVTHGEVVTKPACNASGGRGSARIVLTPQIHNTYGSYNADINFTAHPNNSYTFIFRRTPYTWDQIQAYAIDNTNSWTVMLTAYGATEPDGTPRAASGYQALAQTFCDFG